IEELPPLVLHGADVVLASFALDVARREILFGVGDRRRHTKNGLVSAGEHVAHRPGRGRCHQSSSSSESRRARTAASKRGTVLPSPVSRSSSVTGGRFNVAACRWSSSTMSVGPRSKR